MLEGAPEKRGLHQSLQILPRRAKPFSQCGPIHIVYVLVGEIHGGFDARQNLHQSPAHPPQPRGQPSIQLPHRRPQGPRAPSRHDRRDTFRLCQIDTAVQERPPRELPGLGQARPQPQHEPQHRSLRRDAPVAVELHHVFPCVRARLAHHRQQHLVHDLSVARIHDVSIDKAVRLVRPKPCGPSRPEGPLREGDRLRPAEPHNPNRPESNGSRDRHNGVGVLAVLEAGIWWLGHTLFIRHRLVVRLCAVVPPASTARRGSPSCGHPQRVGEMTTERFGSRPWLAVTTSDRPLSARCTIFRSAGVMGVS